jgi:hypothetical protein
MNQHDQSLAQARDLLGLRHGASADELRAAWKRIAFETHPDRSKGRSSAFQDAWQAYNLLRQGSQSGPPASTRDEPKPVCCASVCRPSIARRVTPLPPAVIEACTQAILYRNAYPGAAPLYESIDLDTGRETSGGRSAIGCVPFALEREGRNLKFLFRGPMLKRVNKVAVPTAAFQNRRLVAPKILIFNADKGSIGEINVPAELVPQVVPGANGVALCFLETE